MLELKSDRRFLLAEFIGSRLHPLFLLICEAAPGLVADEERGIVCFMLRQGQHGGGLIVLVDQVIVDAILGHVDDAGLQRGVDLAERHVHDLGAVSGK